MAEGGVSEFPHYREVWRDERGRLFARTWDGSVISIPVKSECVAELIPAVFRLY